MFNAVYIFIFFPVVYFYLFLSLVFSGSSQEIFPLNKVGQGQLQYGRA